MYRADGKHNPPRRDSEITLSSPLPPPERMEGNELTELLNALRSTGVSLKEITRFLRKYPDFVRYHVGNMLAHERSQASSGEHVLGLRRDEIDDLASTLTQDKLLTTLTNLKAMIRLKGRGVSDLSGPGDSLKVNLTYQEIQGLCTRGQIMVADVARATSIDIIAMVVTSDNRTIEFALSTHNRLLILTHSGQ